MRYQKDIAIAAKASNDDLLRRATQRNINKLQANYKKISEKAGLTPDESRMAVAGFRKVKTADELKNPAKYGIINLEKDIPAFHSLSNKQAREWYLEHDARIPDLINKTASIESQAKQAFDFRNLYRKVARDLMKDQDARKKLDENHPNWTFEGLIAHKMKNKKLSRDEAILDILNTATKTNAEVNAKFGLDVKK